MEDERRQLKPTNDFVFKTIFGQEDSKICLISLLNAILDGNPIIKDVTILNPDLPRYDQLAKESRLDIAAQTEALVAATYGALSDRNTFCSGDS